jgi:hypothetical protein
LYPATILHSTTTQKTTNSVFTAVETSNLAKIGMVSFLPLPCNMMHFNTREEGDIVKRIFKKRNPISFPALLHA